MANWKFSLFPVALVVLVSCQPSNTANPPTPVASASPIAAAAAAEQVAFTPVEQKSPDGEWSSLGGGEVKPPATLRSSAKASAQVKVGDRGSLIMAPDTEVSLEAEGKAVRLFRGGIALNASGGPVEVLLGPKWIVTLESGSGGAVAFGERFEAYSFGGRVTVPIRAEGSLSSITSIGPGRYVSIEGTEATIEGQPETGPEFPKEALVLGFDLPSPAPAAGLRPAMISAEQAGISFSEAGGPGATDQPEAFFELKPDGNQPLPADRTLRWFTRVGEKSLNSYLTVSTDTDPPELLWRSVESSVEVPIPDHVKLPPGRYRWTISPITSKGLVELTHRATFVVK